MCIKGERDTETRVRVPDVKQRRLGGFGPLHRANRRPEPEDIRNERGGEERFVEYWYSPSGLWLLCALRCERRAGPFGRGGTRAEVRTERRHKGGGEEGNRKREADAGRDPPVVSQAQAAPEPRDDDVPPTEEGEPVWVVQEEILGFWEEDFDRCIEGCCDCHHLCRYGEGEWECGKVRRGPLTTLLPTIFSLPNTQNTS